MRYHNIVRGTFVRRENRFIGICLVHGKSERVHIRNTGRCAELFVPGASVFLQYAPSPQKKTAYTLIALYKGERLINLDSLAPNKLVLEYLAQGKLLPGMAAAAEELHGEVSYGASRLDGAFTIAGQRAYLEIKGVTLERDGAAYFPDAPTERGIRHIYELCKARKEGFLAYLIFVIQMQGVSFFAPNYATHPAFAQALQEAQSAGVAILAYDCQVQPECLALGAPVPVKIEDRSSERWRQ